MSRRIHRVVSYILLLAMLVTLAPATSSQAQAVAGGKPTPLTAPASGAGTPMPPLPVAHKVQPTTDAYLPSLTLTAKFDPSFARVGSDITVTLTVRNQAPNPAANLDLSLPLPSGVTTEGKSALSWTQAQLAAGSEMSFTTKLHVAQMPSGRAIVLQPQVTASGLTQSVFATRGVVVTESGNRAAAPETFTPGTAATITDAAAQLQITLPADAATTSLRLTAAATPDESAPGGHTGFGAYNVRVSDVKGEPAKLDKGVRLSIRYTPEQLTALNIAANDLTIFRFDTLKQRWLPLATDVDEVSATASSVTPLGSSDNFQLGDGSSLSAVYLPSLQGWQVNLFTGSLGFGLPIEVPAGPAGLKPNLSLSYDSAATDGLSGLRGKQQAGWAGMGWSLDTGSVALVKGDDGTNDGINYYTMVLNGQSFDLVRGNCLQPNGCNDNNPLGWDWQTTNQSFIRVRAVGNGNSYADPQNPNAGRGGFGGNYAYPRYKWQVWAKDGTLYEYEEDLWWGFVDDPNQPNDGFWETYKWMLSKVTDTHGNTINYQYGRDARYRIGPCCHLEGVADYDAWPTAIRWGGNATTSAPNRYEVLFDSTFRESDTNFDQSPIQIGQTPHQTQKLNSIRVRSNQSNPYNAGAWDLVRQYNLSHDYSLLSDNTVRGPNNEYLPDITTPKLTLTAIQRIGSDGQTALPPMTFSYGLSRGGDSYPLGNWNRLVSINNGQGGTMSVAYDNIGAVIGDGKFANNRRVSARTLNDGRGRSYSYGYSYDHPAYNWLGIVASPPRPANENPNSAALVYSHYFDRESYLVHKAYTEFRGHSRVVETDPNGNQTEHLFYQGDVPGCAPSSPYASCFASLQAREFLKGKEYQTTQRGAAGSHQLSETIRSFTVTPAQAGKGASEDLAGLWYAFSYENQTDDLTWGQNTLGTWLAKTARTTFTYDTSTGNLSSQAEYDATSTPTLLRRSNYYYASRVDANSYILDRRWGEAILDGQNRHLAITLYAYDGSTTIGSLGSTANLTLMRKFYDVPNVANVTGYLLHGSDTSYSYDAYGNQTTRTTYAGYGTGQWNGSSWVMSAPGGGSTPRTATTTFDPIFHALATRIDPPAVNGVVLTEAAGYDLRMGIITSVTDPNGAVSAAEYDVFGRMTKLIKPGDSSAVPTGQFYIYDWEQPMRYVEGRREVAGDASAWRPIQHFYDGLGREIQTKSESIDGQQNIVSDKVYDGLSQVVQESQPRYVNDAQNFWGYDPTADPATERWTTTSYDALGRPLAVTAPDGTSTYNAYWMPDADAIGLEVTTTDARAHKVRSEQDVFGRTWRVREFSGTGPYTLDATTVYAYNPLDLLTSVTDQNGNVTTMSYDTLGRKTAMHDPDMGNYVYTYDANGNLATQRDAKNQTITFGYDELNRLRLKSYSTNGDAAIYNYDEAGVSYGRGKQTSISRVGSTIYYQYDARGRMVNTRYQYAGLSQGFNIGTSYDSADRVQSLSYPSGERVSYTYDAAWRQSSLCSNQAFCYAANTQYTALGQPVQWQLGNGLTQRYTYDNPMSRLSEIKVGNAGNPTALMSRSYTYDPAGNVNTIFDANLGQQQNFTYDQRDRLTRGWTSDDNTYAYDESYTYDPLGNLTRKGSTNYSYGTGGVGPHQAKSVGGQNYNYDANGNLTSGGGRTYTWNAENQPSQITAAGGNETYTYDADGSRIARTANGSTTYYMGSLYEVEQPANFFRIIYTLNGQTIAQRTENIAPPKGNSPIISTIVYLYTDHLGGVSLVTSDQGLLTSQQMFKPFGEVRGGGVSETSLNFTGQRKDGTGLLFYNSRYYDPALARFVSADTIVPGSADGSGGGARTLGPDSKAALQPLTVDFHASGFVGGLNQENAFTLARGFYFQLSDQDLRQAKDPNGPSNPQALNRYSYVMNNPLKYTDPTGHLRLNRAEASRLLIQIRDQFIPQLRDLQATITTFIAGGAVAATLVIAVAAAAEAIGAMVAAIGGSTVDIGAFLAALSDPYKLGEVIDTLTWMQGQLSDFVNGCSGSYIDFGFTVENGTYVLRAAIDGDPNNDLRSRNVGSTFFNAFYKSIGGFQGWTPSSTPNQAQAYPLPPH